MGRPIPRDIAATANYKGSRRQAKLDALLKEREALLRKG
jgi:hypothetical protein